MFRFAIRFAAIVLGLLILSQTNLCAGDVPLKIFGYFQTEFRQDDDSGSSSNSFLLQQLNLFLQRDLARDWTSFVNFEIVNSFSSFRNWGSFNLEEAWVSYRSSEQFKLKFGLQIPEFNNLNNIKNRTPLLPYIIRPFVYETSFGEFFNLDFLTPQRAYIQINGAIPSHGLKIDYAAYMGNTSGIRTSQQVENDTHSAPQSGVDTTNGFMVGARTGIRYKGLKAGFSTTHEKTNIFVGIENFLSGPASNYTHIPLVRLGADLSYNWKNFALETEYINTKFTRDIAPGLKVEAEFYYVTLGYYVNDYLFVYGSMSELTIRDFGIEVDSIVAPNDTTFFGYDIDTDVNMPTVGFSYTLNDRLTFKGQVLLADIRQTLSRPNSTMLPLPISRELDRYALAVSVFF